MFLFSGVGGWSGGLRTELPGSGERLPAERRVSVWRLWDLGAGQRGRSVTHKHQDVKIKNKKLGAVSLVCGTFNEKQDNYILRDKK